MNGHYRRLTRAATLLSILSLPVSALSVQFGDYLTEDEAARIREVQEIYPRTREYLQVVAARVSEIARRSGKAYEVKVPGEKEKKPKKTKKRKEGESAPAEPENPLLFYQLPEVVNGISQSFKAIMTNVDEKYKQKRADAAEIVKALKLLQTFAAQDFKFLDDLEEKARSEQDEKLYRAVRNARDNLERARDGAKDGLSVLEPQIESKKRK